MQLDNSIGSPTLRGGKILTGYKFQVTKCISGLCTVFLNDVVCKQDVTGIMNIKSGQVNIKGSKKTL